MAITPETFELEHFEKLVRGLTVASDAYAKLRADLADAEAARDQLRNQVTSLEESLALGATPEQWNDLVEHIQDTARGIMTLEELVDYAARVA